MKEQIISSKKFIGISARTQNIPGKAEIDIPRLWERFYQEDIVNQIPNKVSTDIYAIYTDYEGDYTKPYTVIIGCEVNSLSDIPEQMVGKLAPASTYLKFDAVGEFPQNIISTWIEIWTASLSRSYTVDYELYKESSSNTNVPIFIAINS